MNNNSNQPNNNQVNSNQPNSNHPNNNQLNNNQLNSNQANSNQANNNQLNNNSPNNNQPNNNPPNSPHPYNNPPTYHSPAYVPRPDREKQPIPFDKRDVLFAVFYLILAYAFIHTFSGFNRFNVNLSIFTISYAIVVLGYAYFRGKRPAKESWFWLAIMLCIGVPYAFWSVLYAAQVLGLMVTAAYWTLSINGNLMQEGRSSQWVMVDTLNALFGVPFANMACQLHILKNAIRRTRMGRRIITIGLGLCIAVPILAIALPLLSRADMGFRDMLLRFLNYIFEHFFTILIKFIFAIPVSFYLFGLSYGSYYQREINQFHPSEIRLFWQKARKVPNLAVNTAAITICLIYLLFIGLQAQYLFAAFTGRLPSYLTYAEYARRGFFELCQIAVLNAIVLLCANAFSKTSRDQNQILQYLNIIFSILTLLLIATAMSKMVLYIGAYGFTIRRIVTTVFMIWLTSIFGLNIVCQWKMIPIIRWILLIGAVLFATLCLFPIKLWVAA